MADMEKNLSGPPGRLFRNAAGLLLERKENYARLITEEMGKIIRESLPKSRNVPMPAIIMRIMRLSCLKTRSFLLTPQEVL